MVAAASASPGCRVARHRAVYRLPRGHPAPAAVRNRLDRLVEGRLSDLVSRILASGLDPRDPRVWLIRRLDVDLAVDLGAVDDEALARAWARQLAAGVGRLLAAGPDGDGVLCFDDRAAYVARFVADRAAGRADGRWYYHDFEALSALPPGVAVREALTREPEAIAGVLALLAAEGEIGRVLAALGSAGAERVLASLVLAAGSDPGAGGAERGRFEALLDAWRRLGDPLAGWSRWGRAGAALFLFGRASAHRPELAIDPGLAAAAGRLVDLARLLRAGDPGTVCDGLAAGDLSALAGALRGRGVDAALAALPALARLIRLAGGDAEWLRSVAEVVASGERPSAETAAPRVVVTPFAGVFFLLPSYLALGLDDALGHDPELRRRVLARCFGAARAAEAEADPALALALPRASGAARPPGEVATPNAGELTRALRGLLIEDRRADGRVVAERIEAEPRDLVVLRDVAADYWLALTPLIGQVPGQGTGEVPEGLEIAGPAALSPDAEPDADGRLRRFRERSKPAAEELAWLACSTRGAPAGDPEGASEVDSEMELAVVLYARAVLRHFAGRLMGFEWSGGEHLWRNFLAGTGSVTVTEDGLDVRLPASPLRLVARMAGAHGLTYELPWHSDRQRGLRVTLELPED